MDSSANQNNKKASSNGEVKFDFSSLLELFGDMKRSFWKLDRHSERFSKSLSRSHNNFY
jgi:hypothetical protein